jgi:hypothetical protein
MNGLTAWSVRLLIIERLLFDLSNAGPALEVWTRGFNDCRQGVITGDFVTARYIGMVGMLQEEKWQELVTSPIRHRLFLAAPE